MSRILSSILIRLVLSVSGAGLIEGGAVSKFFDRVLALPVDASCSALAWSLIIPSTICACTPVRISGFLCLMVVVVMLVSWVDL